MYRRYVIFKNELITAIKNIEELLYEKPTFNNIYALMNWIQKAKVDEAMLNGTLAQMMKTIMKMKNEIPSTSCNVTKAMMVVKGILNAKSINEILKYRSIGKEIGGLDAVVKCIIRDTMLRTVKKFWDFYSKAVVELHDLSAKLKKYEQLSKLLKLK